MTLLKKMLAVGTMVLTISTTSVVAFGATTYKTQAEIVAGLTDKTVEQVIDESMQTGKSFSTIANEAGVLDKFQAENLEIRKSILNEQVANGYLTQAQADMFIANMQSSQIIYDGLGYCYGYGMGGGCGMGYGYYNDGANYNNENGYNNGMSYGRGMGGRGCGGRGMGYYR